MWYVISNGTDFKVVYASNPDSIGQLHPGFSIVGSGYIRHVNACNGVFNAVADLVYRKEVINA